MWNGEIILDYLGGLKCNHKCLLRGRQKRREHEGNMTVEAERGEMQSQAKQWQQPPATRRDKEWTFPGASGGSVVLPWPGPTETNFVLLVSKTEGE